jgi:hypothetical protein
VSLPRTALLVFRHNLLFHRRRGEMFLPLQHRVSPIARARDERSAPEQAMINTLKVAPIMQLYRLASKNLPDNWLGSRQQRL